MQRTEKRGYTLVEIIVALVVFATGALGLAAGSAIVMREMATNGIRGAATRLARNRQETVHSTCWTAQSGSEIAGGIRSEWTVSRPDSSMIRLAGSVSYQTYRGSHSDPYTLAFRCH
jgi:prepilin-type N-terminal cleavage/methylation domain-containing protein